MENRIPSFQETVAFHGHVCPGLAMGYRAAVLALQELEVAADTDEDILVIAENNSCAVDAFQVVTKCTIGKGNLVVENVGKQVYTLARRPSGEAVRLAVCWDAPRETAEETAAWNKFGQGDRSSEIMAVVNQRKAAKVEAIFQASDDELFQVNRQSIVLPKKAQIFPTRICQQCGERMMEPKAQKDEDGQILCVPCYEKSVQSEL